MKESRLLYAFAILSFAGSVALYFFLPASIPTHWNVAGKADSWGPRATFLFIGGLPLITLLLLDLLPRIDPKRESYAKHVRAYAVVRNLIVLALAALAWITGVAGLGVSLDVGVLVRIVVAVLFIGMGNVIGIIRPNYFVGIRTPWTLASEAVWRKTHRRGAYAFIALGVAYAASLAIPPGIALEVFSVAAPLVAVAYVVMYSFLEYRKLPR